MEFWYFTGWLEDVYMEAVDYCLPFQTCPSECFWIVPGTIREEKK